METIGPADSPEIVLFSVRATDRERRQPVDPRRRPERAAQRARGHPGAVDSRARHREDRLPRSEGSVPGGTEARDEATRDEGRGHPGPLVPVPLTTPSPPTSRLSSSLQFLGEPGRQPVAERLVVLLDERQLGQPALGIDLQQDVERGRGEFQARSVSSAPGAGRFPMGVSIAAAAAGHPLEDPLQHAAVLAVARPQELRPCRPCGTSSRSTDAAASPGPRFAPTSQPVREVVAHVVAAEGQHGERIAPQLADLARGGRRGLAAHDRRRGTCRAAS